MTSEELALAMRKDTVQMIHNSHAAHIGAVLSVIDIVAVLYQDVMNYDCKNPKMETRDRLVLSKGHAGVAIYTALAECGFFDRSELKKYYTDGSVYSGHVSSKGVPGVEVSTGSLGHGAGMACGMAIALKRNGSPSRVFAIIGDGECEEGEIWEMALLANKQKLGNFTVIIDHNKWQALGRCEDVIAFTDLPRRWEAFGWNVIDVKDGNDHDQLRDAFSHLSEENPNVIVANTIKGKGVSFMEDTLLWHYRDPQGEAYEQAMQELGGESL